ncbi:MAG: hypothetical protein P8O70_21120 [SAR324 cluster bacterium]|nr:hypothetical protein [SAR324 cluster bacterium]
MTYVKLFFSTKLKSIGLLFTILVGGAWILGSCSPPCGDGDPYGNMEECSVTTDTTSSGGGSGGSTGGSSGGAPATNSITNVSRLQTSYNASQNGVSGYVLDNGSVVIWGRYSLSNIDDWKIVDNLTNVTQISVVSYANLATSGNSYHQCAVRADKTSICWGRGTKGELGDNLTTDCGLGSNSDNYQPTACAVPIFDTAGATSNLKKVQVGPGYTIWLDHDGNVYSAGECESGKLGTNCSSNQAYGIKVNGISNVSDIMVVENRVCAHKQDDTLWCWGENSSNEITSANTNDVQAPLQIASSVKSFAMGSNNIGMVYDNNTVFCTDNFRQSVDQCTTKFAPYTAIKQIYFASGVVGLLLDNGSQVSWGYDYHGHMAYRSGGSPQNNYTVTHGQIYENSAFSLADNISFITSSSGGTVHAIMDNGSVIGVGNNEDRQLGPTNANVQCSWNGGTMGTVGDNRSTCDHFTYIGLSPTGF